MFNANKKRAEHGDPHAQFCVGLEYEGALGVERDYAEAVKWYRMAAEQEQASAQANLGLMYQSGRGVLPDQKEAMRWFHKAAGSGNADALFALGACYYEGRGVLKNRVEAYKWFDLADCFGFGADGLGITTNDAASMRIKAAQEMTQDQIEEAQRASERVLSEMPPKAKEHAASALLDLALFRQDEEDYTKAADLFQSNCSGLFV
jgi:tetratricopeptide (TPR) repeat protein